jgi:hypothetical protein
MILLKAQKDIRDTIRVSILAGWFVVKGQLNAPKQYNTNSSKGLHL